MGPGTHGNMGFFGWLGIAHMHVWSELGNIPDWYINIASKAEDRTQRQCVKRHKGVGGMIPMPTCQCEDVDGDMTLMPRRQHTMRREWQGGKERQEGEKRQRTRTRRSGGGEKRCRTRVWPNDGGFDPMTERATQQWRVWPNNGGYDPAKEVQPNDGG